MLPRWGRRAPTATTCSRLRMTASTRRSPWASSRSLNSILRRPPRTPTAAAALEPPTQTASLSSTTRMRQRQRSRRGRLPSATARLRLPTRLHRLRRHHRRRTLHRHPPTRRQSIPPTRPPPRLPHRHLQTACSRPRRCPRTATFVRSGSQTCGALRTRSPTRWDLRLSIALRSHRAVTCT